MRILRAALALSLLLVALVTSAQARTVPGSRDDASGLEQTAVFDYDDGMHLVVTRKGGRHYVIASASSLTEGAGLRFFDVTDPQRPELVATLPCTGGQGFLQITHDNKTLVVGEGVAHDPSPCMHPGERGFYTIDIRDPRNPKPLGYAQVPRGGHTLTTHPTKPIVYVSYGDPIPEAAPEFQVWSLKNPAKPKHLSSPRVSGYNGPHDIAFNKEGTRAVAASMSAIQVLDTTDPANPVELQVLQCPGCSHNHEAHFTPDQKHVIVSDEASGGAGAPCPLGALYFYKWNPKGDTYMELVGEWQPAEFIVPADAPTNVPLCTSHVFDISSDGTKVAASWHTAGVRVIDITDMEGVGLGAHGDGAKEIAWHVPSGGDAWSAKFDLRGKHVYVNDFNLGFQIYRLANSK